MKKEIFALDTHVCAWLDDPKARRRLSKPVLDAINFAERLIIPGMVVLELHYLEERKRIRSARAVMETLEEIGGQYSSAPTGQVALLAAGLSWTGDPFDRLICADALYNRATLITADETIREHFELAYW